MEIRTQKSVAEIRAIVDTLPVGIGGGPDPYGLGDAFWAGVANSLYDDIHNAFILKSYGLNDDLGNGWDSLSLETKAYDRPDLRRQMNLPNKGKKNPKTGKPYRPTLSAEADKAWRMAFMRKLFALNAKAPDIIAYSLQDAHAQLLARSRDMTKKAAQSAWDVLKNRYGATTLKALAASLDAPINFRTGALLDSLKPTNTSPYRPAPNQLFKVDSGGLTLGSTLEYASEVHKKRPLWPDNYGPWIAKANRYGRNAVNARLAEVL